MKKYPVCKPDLSGLELEYVTNAVKTGWISSKGKYIQEFEKTFADWNGMKHALTCNSGTSALFLALKAIGIKEGDEVIVPEFTMIASAWAVTHCGATPVFVDCDDRLCIDVEKIEEKITSKTKAIMPVHIYGRQCDMKAIKKIAIDNNLIVIEDCAESLGVKPEGDVACFSLFANKLITAGEGGVCLTNNPRIARQIELLKGMYFDEAHTFLHPKVGYNLRMTNVQAAVALAQTKRLFGIIEKRDLIEEWYNKYIPKNFQMPKRNMLWMYDVRVDDPKQTLERLEKLGVEGRYFFKPMSRQPMYFNENYVSLKAHKFSEKGIYLPTYTALNEDEVRDISIRFVNSQNKTLTNNP